MFKQYHKVAREMFLAVPKPEMLPRGKFLLKEELEYDVKLKKFEF